VSKPSIAKFRMPSMWVADIAVLTVAVAGGAALFSASGAKNARAMNQIANKSQPTVSTEQRGRVRASLDALPLGFEANQGQTDPQVKYTARGNGYKLYLSSSHATMALAQGRTVSEVQEMMLHKRRGAAGVKALIKKGGGRTQEKTSVASLRMDFVGGNARGLVGQNQQAGKVNYFVGNDPAKWHSNIPLFSRVEYQGLYPGIDLAFLGESKILEFDYVVHPGADARKIALGFHGAHGLDITPDGNLMIATATGPLQLHKPVAYQDKDGKRQGVDAWFVADAKDRITFGLGPYDHARELVIDPTVTYSTYFGGNGPDYATSIAVDASGNAFIAGTEDSASIPGHSVATAGFDVFVSELTPSGNLVFTTVFGGSSDDFPGGIAVDSQGIYVAGTTDSNDFSGVTVTSAQNTFLGGSALHGNNDAFAVKLPLSGSLPPTWATYVGGSDSDSGLGIAVDSSHNVYVVGETFSTNLGGVVGGVNPLPSGGNVNLGLGTGSDDGYIVKLNSTATAYSLVSYIGGSNGDLATGVALDVNGNIYVSGETISTDLPVTAGVVQNKCGTDGTCNNTAGPLDDAFAVSIKANLSGYNYVTYYGGSLSDDAFAIAADATGNAFLTGTTRSTDFRTAGTPIQSALAGTQNSFVLELNSTGTAATYGSYFGGNGTDTGLAIAVDASDNVYLTGQTTSLGNFPLQNATQAALSGSSDAFVSVVSTSQGQLLFSTYLGGGGDENQFFAGIDVDSSGRIYVTGETDSGGSTAVFPTTSGAVDGTFGGGTCTSGSTNVPCPDAFITAYGSATTPDFAIAATTPAAVNPGTSGTSTVTLTALNAFSQQVTLACSVSGGGSPAPSCSAASAFSTNPVTPANPGATSTLTITTTGAAASLYRKSTIYYAMWLPIVGMSLIGMRFSTTGSRKNKLLGFLLLGIVMAMLFFLPACGGSSGGPKGCPGCTPAGNYKVTVTGTQGGLSHSTQVTLTVK
jgi:hypothetical protein